MPQGVCISYWSPLLAPGPSNMELKQSRLRNWRKQMKKTEISCRVLTVSRPPLHCRDCWCIQYKLLCADIKDCCCFQTLKISSFKKIKNILVYHEGEQTEGKLVWMLLSFWGLPSCWEPWNTETPQWLQDTPSAEISEADCTGARCLAAGDRPLLPPAPTFTLFSALANQRQASLACWENVMLPLGSPPQRHGQLELASPESVGESLSSYTNCDFSVALPCPSSVWA